MEPSTILRSDALDILFENRNKQYGAYTLRREYPKRLLKAMVAMAGVVLAVNWILLTNGNSPKLLKNPWIFDDTARLINIPPNPVDPPKPPEPPRTTPPTPPAASLQYVVPQIVPDPQATDPLPEVNDLANKQISTITQDGPASDGIVRPPESTGNGTAAPIEPPVEKALEILETAAVMPSFPGGTSALQRWLSRNLRPQDNMEPGQRIKVVARFVVDVHGRINGIQLVQTGGDPYDQEVLRVIKKMPQWNPGKQNGQTVAVWFNIPIIFETPAE